MAHANRDCSRFHSGEKQSIIMSQLDYKIIILSVKGCMPGFLLAPFYPELIIGYLTVY